MSLNICLHCGQEEPHICDKVERGEGMDAAVTNPSEEAEEAAKPTVETSSPSPAPLSPELLPCPFCGGDMVYTDHQNDLVIHENRVGCIVANIIFPVGRWNRRAASPPPSPKLDYMARLAAIADDLKSEVAPETIDLMAVLTASIAKDARVDGSVLVSPHALAAALEARQETNTLLQLRALAELPEIHALRIDLALDSVMADDALRRIASELGRVK